jgi:diamine N-acetyltransferase
MIIKVTMEDQITIVETLAGEIWTEHYTPIIGKEQVRYMLDKFQSKDAISGQIRDEGFQYFLIEEGKKIYRISRGPIKRRRIIFEQALYNAQQAGKRLRQKGGAISRRPCA